jgi:hypothetical protein
MKQYRESSIMYTEKATTATPDEATAAITSSS